MDQPLSEFSDHKALWSRRTVAQGTMRPEAIVFPSPALDKDLRFHQRISYLVVKRFIPELPDEGLDVAVFSVTKACPNSSKALLWALRMSSFSKREIGFTL